MEAFELTRSIVVKFSETFKSLFSLALRHRDFLNSEDEIPEPLHLVNARMILNVITLLYLPKRIAHLRPFPRLQPTDFHIVAEGILKCNILPPFPVESNFHARMLDPVRYSYQQLHRLKRLHGNPSRKGKAAFHLDLFRLLVKREVHFNSVSFLRQNVPPDQTERPCAPPVAAGDADTVILSLADPLAAVRTHLRILLGEEDDR